MIPLALATSLAFGCLPPQEAAEDAEEILQVLIERTNGLDAFRAVYRMAPAGREELRLELGYESPSELQLAFYGADDGGLRMGMWVTADELCTLVESEEGTQAYARFEWARPDAFDVLERRFPNSLDGSLGPGPYVRCDFEKEPKAGRGRFSLETGWSPLARSALVGWPQIFLQESERVHVGPEELSLEADGYRFALSRSTGFLTEAAHSNEDGSTDTLRLEELMLGADAEPACEDLPERPDGAQDHSEAMRASWHSALFSPNKVRSDCLARIRSLLDSGDVDWDDDTRTRCEEVLRAVYVPWLDDELEEYLQTCRQSSEDYARWLGRGIEEGVPPDELRKHADARRRELQETVGSGLEPWLEARETPPPAAEVRARWSHLVEFDEAVFAKVYHERVVQRALDDFDAAVEDAIGG